MRVYAHFSSKFLNTNFQYNIQLKSPQQVLKFLRRDDLYTIFPNVDIVYRIFGTMAVTNCSAERSFSCLKRIKNYLRSTITEDRLNNLALLCIESDILLSLDFEDIITDFTNQKTRRKCF